MTNIEEFIAKNASFIENSSDLSFLIEKIKNKKIVMLGESTHGTHEFYEWHRIISQELIQKYGMRNEKQYVKSLFHIADGCKRAALKALDETLKIRLEDLSKQESLFDAQQNARIVKNAELYYSTMIHGDEDSWNVRDRHMMEALNHLLRFYGHDSKAIVWAHNTHVDDYRATDMVSEDLVNIGGLARLEWRDQVSLIGFGTYEGDLT